MSDLVGVDDGSAIDDENQRQFIVLSFFLLSLLLPPIAICGTVMAATRFAIGIGRPTSVDVAVELRCNKCRTLF